MTFIASVIAKEGVAIIADSLVTTSIPSLDFQTFQEYLTKASKESGKEIVINTKEIAKLFKVKPSHTKDYEEKLYKYDKYTAITTAGSASINNKRIKKLIGEAIRTLKPNGRNNAKEIIAKIDSLKEFIVKEVKKFLEKNSRISETIFLVTFYSPTPNKTTVYKLTVNKATNDSLKDESFEYVSILQQPDQFKVICDGQNRLAERLLFGDLNGLFEIIPRIIGKVAKDFSLPAEKVGEEYWMEVIQDKSIIDDKMMQDMKIYRLTELSLQQAVDLATLLMRIEIDIQKYTENIPTVGGVIKLAVIDNDGFRFISGNEIVKHEVF
ncbi:hypothetical protein [Pedobacter boryungensis]|uniref:Uncharacterized protein n=1 Tax=Pedobacter boryungensis TaxID=869962 RepID=A0ABX2DC45_9SPHI|nr:hypothetical protein [Pedobacter boryungensis]NQX31640.1 hypothetical protein [Pedobacter boryungensis]